MSLSLLVGSYLPQTSGALDQISRNINSLSSWMDIMRLQQWEDDSEYNAH